jgi:hypothetical protein
MSHSVDVTFYLTRAESPSSSGLLWPLGTGKDPYPLIQTYGQFEGCSGSQGLHHGVDMAPLDDIAEPVFALEAGVVTQVIADSPYYSGVVVRSQVNPERGLQYLHLDEYSVVPKVGDVVAVDQLLGYVTTIYKDCEPHLHLARLEISDAVAEDVMPGDQFARWNPLLEIAASFQARESKPETLPGTLFVRDNETSDQSHELDSLPVGPLDVVVKAEDRDGLGDGFRQAFYEVEVRIEPKTPTPEMEQVNKVLRLGGALPEWANRIYNRPDVSGGIESIGCCQDHEFEFYFVPTNADPDDPDQEPSRANHWAAVTGDYEITLRLRDAAGNEYGLEQPVSVTVQAED